MRKRWGFMFSRYIVTTCAQGGHAPLVDRCFVEEEHGKKFEGIAILLTPWRRNQWGESLPQTALVFGRER